MSDMVKVENETHIFNGIVLKGRLDGYDINLVLHYEEKKNIILKWKNSISDKTLFKTKEKSLQGIFLTEFFGNILGYRKCIGNKQWNITFEQKTKADGTASDGALGFFTAEYTDIRVVIELKDANTDLNEKQKSRESRISPVEQAFLYAAKDGIGCNWIIVSNFIELRLYNSRDLTKYERFNLFNLDNEGEFKRFYYLLCFENLIEKDSKSVVDILFEKNETAEAQITKQFYKDYKITRTNLLQVLKDYNKNKDDLVLLEKTQKLMDRFIFVCVCQGKGLIPQDSFQRTIELARNSFDNSDCRIWNQMKFLFHSIDEGNMYAHINRFNGGLFKEDIELNQLVIPDFCFSEFENLSKHNFYDELNINILGHIFEQSISDLEEIKTEIQGQKLEKSNQKRKKDGVFYTPEHITKFIVENVISKWLEERRQELGEDKLPEIKFDNRTKGTGTREKKIIRNHLNFWRRYRDMIANMKILDPACGSGAFLCQAYDYLLQEANRVDKKISNLIEGQLEFYELKNELFVGLDKQILKNNLFGVDINRESIEIAKLSLWLKTAKRNDTLVTLDDHFRCGNSLIDDGRIAGNSAFKWDNEFSEIFKNGGFDIIVANPPYIFSREKIGEEEKKYFISNYETSEFQLNTFSLFIEKAQKLLSKNGYFGFIVPNSLLKISSLTKIRKYILKHGKIHQIAQLFGTSFENASVETVIIIYSNDAISDNIEVIDVYKKQDLINGNPRNISAKEWINDSECRFQVSIDEESSGIIHKLITNSDDLETMFDVRAGLEAYGTGRGEPMQTEEEAKKRSFHYERQIDNNTYRYLEGKDIDRYSISWSSSWLSYGKHLASPREFKIFSKPRILIREITGGGPYTILGQFTDELYLNNRSIINILSKEDNLDDLKCLLLILNSSLMSYYFKKVTSKSERKLFPKIILRDLRKFPIKLPEDKATLAKYADKAILLKQQYCDKLDRFTSFIKTVYKPDKVSERIQKFYQNNFNCFIEELEKFNAMLTAREKYELMDLFEKEKLELLNMESQIVEFQKSVDTIIYKLYNLTEDEVKIIENDLFKNA